MGAEIIIREITYMRKTNIVLGVLELLLTIAVSYFFGMSFLLPFLGQPTTIVVSTIAAIVISRLVIC